MYQGFRIGAYKSMRIVKTDIPLIINLVFEFVHSTHIYFKWVTFNVYTHLSHLLFITSLFLWSRKLLLILKSESIMQLSGRVLDLGSSNNKALVLHSKMWPFFPLLYLIEDIELSFKQYIWLISEIKGLILLNVFSPTDGNI